MFKRRVSESRNTLFLLLLKSVAMSFAASSLLISKKAVFFFRDSPMSLADSASADAEMILDLLS